MSWYTVKIRGGFVKFFVDYENVVRMMVMQAVILVISMCMVRIESKGLAFYRFTTSMVLVWQLVFEMFGALVWNEITGAFGFDNLRVSEKTLIGQAYDLIDPRGRLDLLLQDKELYPILLAIAGRRHMDENFRFMKDVRQLKRMVGTEANSLTVRAGDNYAGKISRLTLQVIDNYIMSGAAHTETKAVESLVALHQVEVDIHKLLWMAYAETAILVHQSNVLGMFSKNPTVCDILKCRVDKLTALCGTDARLVKPPKTTNLLLIEEGYSSNSVRDEA
ncbi:hypothetical protein SARC_07885 [Sphaeroforma arctica JP610]|uniref:Uncharacterized protein n=1 Tax=Sphaeroforma arctica JP610 TaxID=667725 RepID=A0A0L0FSI4_9EUKA|nr:hypothetical protein SARC_07885 [Sphaeroforma arctica JP610]KNC79725.1 hypothetical protein SARC_07885 [Sphaeroforma arctica JP610]|eukprot:XP_014153627.1 hypothetical protein SARC_07885 [Sphaeroforma arctica JP610]